LAHTHSNSADKRYFDQTKVLTFKPTILETWKLALPTLPARVVPGIGRIYAFTHDAGQGLPRFLIEVHKGRPIQG